VILLISPSAIYFLIDGSLVSVLIGSFLTIVILLAVERMLCTQYTLTDDNLLIVKRGHFARKIVIPLNEILIAEKMKGGLLFVSFVLIEHGADHFVSVQTDDDDAFVRELKERQRASDLTQTGDETK